MPATPPPTPGSRAEHPEGAQAVWQVAVQLAGDATDDTTDEVVALLRAAGFDPSTLQHALALGRTRVRRQPHDRRLRHGQRLLVRSTEWLGARPHAREVGTVRSRPVASQPPARPTAPPAGGQHA